MVDDLISLDGQMSPPLSSPTLLQPPSQPTPQSTCSIPPPPLKSELEDEFSTTDDQSDPTELSHRPRFSHLSSVRSSISSLPGSVIHNSIFSDTDANTSTHSRRADSPAGRSAYHAAFRRLSSIRALQLESEASDTPSRRSPRTLSFPRSPGSAHSSPTKKLSRNGTPRKLKKEFPLVLLHCTLLPTVPTPQAVGVPAEIIEAVLPEPYKQRWKKLQEKTLQNTEIRQRGALISHPRDDYELLEERLLEVLELEQPRIHAGHYAPSVADDVDTDSGFESSSQTSDTDKDVTIEHTECPDCGCQISTVNAPRKWDIKVYAANGLMRAGAWSAAWQEMEKVDVELCIWLPDNVKQEVEERLTLLQAKNQELEESEPVQQLEPTPTSQYLAVPKEKHGRRSKKQKQEDRMKEIYGEKPATIHEQISSILDDLNVPPTAVEARDFAFEHIDNGEDTIEIQTYKDTDDSRSAEFVRRHLDFKMVVIIILALISIVLGFRPMFRNGSDAPVSTVVPIQGFEDATKNAMNEIETPADSSSSGENEATNDSYLNPRPKYTVINVQGSERNRETAETNESRHAFEPCIPPATRALLELRQDGFSRDPSLLVT